MEDSEYLNFPLKSINKNLIFIKLKYRNNFLSQKFYGNYVLADSRFWKQPSAIAIAMSCLNKRRNLKRQIKEPKTQKQYKRTQ